MRRCVALLAIVAALLWPLPASAAAKPFPLLGSSALTSSGNTTPTQVATITMLEVRVFVTAVSGTTPQLDLWLESCTDTAATNCAPMLATTVSKDPSTITASDPTVTTNARDIVNAKTSTTSEVFTALYQTLPTSYIRVRYIISGTTPSFTVQVQGAGK